MSINHYSQHHVYILTAIENHHHFNKITALLLLNQQEDFYLFQNLFLEIKWNLKINKYHHVKYKNILT